MISIKTIGLYVSSIIKFFVQGVLIFHYYVIIASRIQNFCNYLHLLPKGIHYHKELSPKSKFWWNIRFCIFKKCQKLNTRFCIFGDDVISKAKCLKKSFSVGLTEEWKNKQLKPIKKFSKICTYEVLHFHHRYIAYFCSYKERCCFIHQIAYSFVNHLAIVLAIVSKHVHSIALCRITRRSTLL